MLAYMQCKVAIECVFSLVTKAAERLQKLVVEEGVSQENAFNLSSVQLVKAATVSFCFNSIYSL